MAGRLFRETLGSVFDISCLVPLFYVGPSPTAIFGSEDYDMTENAITLRELAAMKARLEATTPGPWISNFEGRDHTSGDSFIKTGTQEIYISAEDYIGGGGHFCADQDFIAHARQDMPRLIAEIERLQRLVDPGES
jgi:hypothetical protein